jgi:hypothetical protein
MVAFLKFEDAVREIFAVLALAPVLGDARG